MKTPQQEAAAILGRKGGKAATGAKKDRGSFHYAKMAAKSAAVRARNKLERANAKP